MLRRFLESKTQEIHVNTVNVLGGISFHVMAENRKHLKDTLAFSSFLIVIESKENLVNM